MLASIAFAVLGALTGFSATYGASIVVGPVLVLGGLLYGAIFGLVITIAGLVTERWTLEHLRGYRRLSLREREKMAPLLEQAARRLGIASPPPLLVYDSPIPSAWAHSRR